MNINNFTIKSQEALQQAQQLAQELGHQQVEKELESFPEVSGGNLMFSNEAGKTLNEASILAKNMGDEFVSVEHLLLAIFKSKSKIARILKDQGITEKDFKSA